MDPDKRVPKTVELVLPVYNGEELLKKNALILLDYLNKHADFSWNIVIADNASTDKTSEIAKELSAAYKNIAYKYIPKKGRGYALKTAFLQSDADIACYMDLDLSANLRHLIPLIDGVRNGHDAAIGSRLIKGARVKRSFIREVISRAYNTLLKILFLNKFSDAQCGFKAFRTDVIKKLIPLVRDNSWFFDTELLLVMEYNKFSIFEIPVEWVQDMRTTVNIPKTILDDLAGIARVKCTLCKKIINKL